MSKARKPRDFRQGCVYGHTATMMDFGRYAWVDGDETSLEPHHLRRLAKWALAAAAWLETKR
jgi:hypothetical protein